MTARGLDSLALRLTAILGVGLLAMIAGIMLVISWPDQRPMLFRLISPVDTAAMARALEAAPPQARPQIVAALNNGATIVELIPHFPPEGAETGPLRAAPRLERQFERFSGELEGRPFRVQTRTGGIFGVANGASVGSAGPVRLLVQLRTGEVLVVERAPVVLQRMSARLLVIGAVILGVMLLTLVVCLHAVRPVDALARAARRFAEDIASPDLPVRGARELRGLAGAFNDMQRTIRALVEDRTRMLGAIAHDMRTYLTRLRLRVDFIEDPDQRARAVADIDEMSLLLDDTLMFAREATAPAVGRAPWADAQAEVAAFLTVRVEMNQKVATLAMSNEALPVACAPMALRRMLANLVDNALRYGGSARVGAAPRDGQVAIVVEDEGPGAPDEALAHLTAPFLRLEPSRGRQTGGAGLGLAIVKALAESQGGGLTLANRPEGGLRATILLPSAPPREGAGRHTS